MPAEIVQSVGQCNIAAGDSWALPSGGDTVAVGQRQHHHADLGTGGGNGRPDADHLYFPGHAPVM